MKLLTRVNPKLKKNLKFQIHSFGLHLAPYNLSGLNVCPYASKGCAKACLNKSGFGYFSTTQQSRIQKTKYFLNEHKKFMLQLRKEIGNKVKYYAARGVKISIRLNLTSDLPWESYKIEGKNLMEWFPNVQFIDYTKNPHRMKRFVDGKLPPNYHLTFSRSESNEKDCLEILENGGNVAVVFQDKNFPEIWNGKQVINGTEHDMRSFDLKNCVVGLNALGQGRKDTSGFVIKTK